MRSFLLKNDDYNKLMKMDVNEIASYLQGSQYRKEIDEFGVKFGGVQLLELALNRNLANTWNKLKKVSPPGLRALISAYLLGADVWNLKTIIRAKYTKLGLEQLQAMLLPSGFLTEKKLAELAKKESVEDVLKSVGFIEYGYFSKAIEEFVNTNSVAGIENALDRFYHSAMDEFAGRIPREGRLFREFIEGELEVSAMINILRLKRAGTPSKDIERFVIIPHAAKSMIRKMINAPSAQDAAKLLEQSRFRAFAETGVKEFLATGSLIMLELDLSRQMLKRSALLMHQHPLTVDVILGYMFAKGIEVRNLKLMLKARQLGMTPEFAEQQIVAI